MNAALLAVTLLVSCLAGELIVRLVRPRPLEAAYVWSDGTLRHLPSFRHVYTRPGFSNTVSYNALGLRGPEVAPRPSPGVPRVLFLGDSFLEGKQVADDRVLTAVLAATAAARGWAIEPINAGVSGYGTAEEIILWERLGAALRPDVVVLCFYPNDVRNNADRKLFILREGKVEAAREPPLPKVRWVYDARKFLAARSHLYILIKQGLDLFDAEPSGEAAPLEAEDVFAREPTAKVSAGWDLTLALLADLRDRVTSRGAKFMLVMLPTRFQVDDALWAGMLGSRGMEADRFDLSVPQQRLTGWAAREEIALVDLLPAFKEANRGNTFYHAVDAHWNEEGHRLAAERIYEELVGAGALPTLTRAGRSTESLKR